MKKRITIIGLVIFMVLILLMRPYYLFLTQKVKISPLKTLFSFDSLKIFDNQINVLILGIAGGTHEGPNLSDLIIAANYNLKTNKLTTMAVPRDIWSETLRDRVNSAYAYGEAKEKGGGLKLAKAEVAAIIGKPVQYAAVIDFDKFKTLIDFFGGIDVDVQKSFTDKQFPIPGREDDLCGGKDPDYKCRFETISFTKGLIRMDGNTALKFVRSRHAEGSEGSDFARGQRQQQVILALKNHILNDIKTFNLNKITTLYEKLDQLVVRDMTNQQLSILAKNIVMKPDFKQQEIILEESFFIVPRYDLYEGKYVLIPETENFNQIHQYIECNLKNLSNCDSLKNKREEN